jgi:Fe2+ or Zn2+ uptake regulation protein
MNVSETTTQILDHFSIQETEIRKALLEILLLLPNEIHSIDGVNQKLKSKGMSISLGALVQNLLMFQIRGLIKTVNLEADMKRKRGRPQLKFVLNHDLISQII